MAFLSTPQALLVFLSFGTPMTVAFDAEDEKAIEVINKIIDL